MSKQKLNMTIGRFQPFTQGHLNMVNEGNGPCIVYRINSSDKKIERKKKGIKIASKSWTDESVNNVIEYIDNPTGDLTEQEKELLKRPFTNELINKELEIVKKNNKNIIDVVPVINMFEALARFNKFILDNSDKYEPQYWMCGDDRVNEYSELIDKYDKLAIERGGEEFENVVKGKLKTSTGKGRTEGVSGTAVRKAILNKDKASFEKIMPKGVGQMFDDFTNAFDEFKEKLQGLIKENLIFKNYINNNMKHLINYVNEMHTNQDMNFPDWAEYMCINIFDEEINFYTSKEDKMINDTPELKKMKYGDIYRDKDDLLWICIKDTENLKD